jgi:hypothetical protein
MNGGKGFSTLTAGVCFTLIIIIVCVALVFDLGHSAGLRQGRLATARPVVRQGELPYNTPVMVYTLRDDGTITGESAVRTNYAGVLPFSTTGHKVPYDRLEGYDYWMDLEPIFTEVKP